MPRIVHSKSVEDALNDGVVEVLPSSAIRAHRSGDAGDTLIEVLVAITILGLTAVSLLGAFAADITGARTYRNTSQVEIALKDFAESALYQIEYAPNPVYAPCAVINTGTVQGSTSTITYNGTTISPAIGLDPGITITAVIAYYSPTAPDPSNPFLYPLSSCDSTQSEPQLITLTATNLQGETRSLAFVVENLQYEKNAQV